MIAQIKTGKNFSGLFHYLLKPNKNPRVLGGNAAGETIAELSYEFSACAKQRQRTRKPVKHFSIAFAPDDGKIPDETKIEIAAAVVEGLGYTNNQYIVIDHHRNDPGHDWTHDHDHIHIAVNAIDLDGKRVNDHQDKRRMEKLLRQQEIAHNLTHVPCSWEKSRRSPTHGQAVRYKKEKREYEEGKRNEPPKVIVSEYLQDAIEAASADRPTISRFVHRLQEQGIEVYPRLVKRRIQPQGFSYTYDGVKIPGYKLSGASFPKLLSERGLQFSPSRDLPTLQEARARSEMAMAAAKDEPTTATTTATPATTPAATAKTTETAKPQQQQSSPTAIKSATDNNDASPQSSQPQTGKNPSLPPLAPELQPLAETPPARAATRIPEGSPDSQRKRKRKRKDNQMEL